ncbi:hypothetical protein FACS1894205_1750 [Alphaproteobacteria bacterium]|nr:hypothetical protein FACS1894205_1750 [Alphaproteobacteria bacterium]
MKRVYYIHGTRRNVDRGFHAHKTLRQCIVALGGTVVFRLEGKGGEFKFTLNEPDEALLIPPGYWREMTGMDSDTVIMVLASHEYDEEDYIRNYDDFQHWLNQPHVVSQAPYLDLTRYNPLLEAPLEAAFRRIMAKGTFINGASLAAFEEGFARFCQMRHAVGVANGLDALTIILQVMGVGAGDEVIVCAAGFAATPMAVSRVGATPVFVDCEPGGNMDPASIDAAVTKASRAILLTHLYGVPARMDEIEACGLRHHLPVIADACQAHGALWRGRPCETLAFASAFSFYPTKNLGAMGDGGMIVTNDSRLAEQARIIANYGAPAKYRHDYLGLNSRLDEMQAAFLLVKLPFLSEWNEKRRRFAALYTEKLSGVPGLVLPSPPKESLPVWHVYAVRVGEGRRNGLMEHLERRRVGVNIHYPAALHQLPCYSRPDSFPEAEALAEETLSLPLDAMHEEEEILYVCEQVREFFSAAARSCDQPSSGAP